MIIELHVANIKCLNCAQLVSAEGPSERCSLKSSGLK